MVCHVVILAKKAHPEQPQKHLCVDHHDLNNLLPPIVKAQSKAQGVLSLGPVPKVDEVYAMLTGSTVYSLLDGTSGYHLITLLYWKKINLILWCQLESLNSRKYHLD